MSEYGGIAWRFLLVQGVREMRSHGVEVERVVDVVRLVRRCEDGVSVWQWEDL
jgi:hypothetical protein